MPTTKENKSKKIYTVTLSLFNTNLLEVFHFIILYMVYQTKFSIYRVIMYHMFAVNPKHHNSLRANSP